MAVLKPLTRIQRAQALHVPAPRKASFRPLFQYDAHVDAYRAHLVANYVGKVTACKTVGKALRCQKWYQADYRSATPKGVTLLSDKLRGLHARFAIN